EQKDSEFTWSDFRDKVNNELADVLGNFVNRVLVLTKKYYDGAVPAAPTDEALNATDRNLLESLSAAPAKVGDLIGRHRYKEAQLEAMNVARLGNKYLTEQEPWKLQKTDPARTATIMHLTCQVVGNCAVLLEPFLPQTAAKIAAAFGVSDARWNDASTDLVSAGTVLGDLPILFTKIDDDTVAAQVAKLGQKGDASDSSTRDLMPAKDEITFDDFTKLDLRVGTVLECEKVPKADKLLKLTVDTGLDTRTVVSGIAEHFAPEDVVGRQVTLLINLAPRKLRGIESQGMVLMASTDDGDLRFVTPEEGVLPGNVIS
ncbi:MAG TPA: methionine--tRNA ligase subunit beta, partial [Flavobacteriales bacterium]|nr:methionine--tRNA ligase subunit beta [Flavobacteriales bacterium]